MKKITEFLIWMLICFSLFYSYEHFFLLLSEAPQTDSPPACNLSFGKHSLSGVSFTDIEERVSRKGNKYYLFSIEKGECSYPAFSFLPPPSGGDYVEGEWGKNSFGKLQFDVKTFQEGEDQAEWV